MNPQARSSSAAPSPSAAGVSEGQAAPDVRLRLEDGSVKSLSDFRGKNLVLFFYPKDETRGCTIEAQGFRDSHAALQEADTVVFGVSLQGEASHQSFIQKENLPYHLVADTDGTVAKAFGVQIKGEYASRDTVLIDKSGKIKRIWRRVNPRAHAQHVLESIR